MTLEDLVKEVMQGAGAHSQIRSLASAYGRDQTNGKYIEAYSQMTGLPLDDLKAASPILLRENMDAAAKSKANQAVEAMSRNYKSLVAGLSDEEKIAMALGASGKNRTLQEVQEMIEAEKFDDVRALYSQTFEEPEWKHFFSKIAQPKTLSASALSYYGKKVNNFGKQFVVDGKIDSSKLTQYLNEAISGDEASRNKAYLGAALGLHEFYVAQGAMKKMEEERKKAEAKKAKKKE
jgi:hypothetical protein